MDIEKAKEIVKEQLTKERYEHTIRVCDTAIELANLYGLSTEKAAVASIFHDYAKCFSKETLKEYIQTYELPKELLVFHHELWHGPVAASILQDKMNMNDVDILNAIYYHTTGRAGMSSLELLIFVSDYIEPGRNIPGVDEVREIAKHSLEKAARLILKNTIVYLLHKNATIFPDTFYAYNELTKKGGLRN